MKKNSNEPWPAVRAKIFRMVSVGVIDEPVNQAYDAISIIALVANLMVGVMGTFDNLQAAYGGIFILVEQVTVFLFGVDYVLRVITAPCLYPNAGKKAYLKYALSFAGIIDLLSFLPYYLPMFFPAGAVAFRLFRVARILRLFRINAYYDSLNVISDVIVNKGQQLLSSVFILAVMMLSSSLAMYSIEHQAQPDIFKNAFSGLWWAVSTLLTVGYGDIYPVTTLGKFFGIVITFLGVGMVAIPTGIISAGFVEQYTRQKRLSDYAREQDLHFVKIELKPQDEWTGKMIRDLKLPSGMIIAVIQRGSGIIVPRGDIILKAGDMLVLAAEALKNDRPVQIREITLKKNHEWNNTAIRDLNISRQSYIVMVRREGQAIVPNGGLVLKDGDTVILYSKERLPSEELTTV